MIRYTVVAEALGKRTTTTSSTTTTTTTTTTPLTPLDDYEDKDVGIELDEADPEDGNKYLFRY